MPLPRLRWLLKVCALVKGWSVSDKPLHCGTIWLIQAQLSAALKVQLEFESQFLLKCPFLIVFSKIYRPTKVDVLGTWEVGILLRNSWRFFFVSLLGYPKVTSYVPKMASTMMSLYISSSFSKLACHLVTAFETIPVVSWRTPEEFLKIPLGGAQSSEII